MPLEPINLASGFILSSINNGLYSTKFFGKEFSLSFNKMFFWLNLYVMI